MCISFNACSLLTVSLQRTVNTTIIRRPWLMLGSAKRNFESFASKTAKPNISRASKLHRNEGLPNLAH